MIRLTESGTSSTETRHGAIKARLSLSREHLQRAEQQSSQAKGEHDRKQSRAVCQNQAGQDDPKLDVVGVIPEIADESMVGDALMHQDVQRFGFCSCRCSPQGYPVLPDHRQDQDGGE